MKKILFFIYIILTINTFSESVNIQKIAVVDISIVLEQYSKKNILEDKLNKKREASNKKIAALREESLKKELELLKDGEKVKKKDIEELDEMNLSIQENIRAIDKELNSLYNNYMQELITDISVGAVVVGREMGFDIVFHKGTTFYGGTDITKEVIKFLNSGEKISLSEDSMKDINNDIKKYSN